MRFVGIQDNLSKVKIVEELCQQVLRFPEEAHLALVSELAREREVRKKQVLELDESDGSKAERRKEFEDEEEEMESPEYRGRKKPPAAMPWEEEERQCSIDFRA
jgi:hypothetical protein